MIRPTLELLPGIAIICIENVIMNDRVKAVRVISQRTMIFRVDIMIMH